MPEEVIIAEFKKCRVCGSEETVARKASQGIISENTFVALEHKITPLEQPMLAGVMVKAIRYSNDACAGCGTWRCTRADLISVFTQQPGQPSGGYQFPNRAQRRHPS
jgi:hypothetical protein